MDPDGHLWVCGKESGVLRSRQSLSLQTLEKLVGPYYKTGMENARFAMIKQPAIVDARKQTDFILQRTES